MYLSDSECFVLGAVEEAARMESNLFTGQLREINRLLGIGGEPAGEHVFKQINAVPPDTAWSRGDTESRLGPDEFVALREELTADRRAAEEWLAESDKFTGLTEPLNAFLKMVAAFGYSVSTPTELYGLSQGGDLFLVERIPELPEGLLRLLIVQLSSSTPLPLCWRAAVPNAVSDVPEAFWAESFAADPDCTDLLCGPDDPAARLEALRSLGAAETHSDAHGLGGSLWKLRACLMEAEAGRNADVEIQGEEVGTAPITDTPGIDLPAHMPDVLKRFVGLGLLIQSLGDSGTDGPERAAAEKWSGTTTALLAAASSYAESLGMPGVLTILENLGASLNAGKSHAEMLALLRAGEPGSLFVSRDDLRLVESAFCVAYGDLLLRERFSPPPIPQGAARQRLLAQPENVRTLITTALAGLRRDAGKRANFSVELVLLCNVLERLVREAAAIHLPATKKYKVADLLHELRNSARDTPPEDPDDVDDMETIARVGLAVHHAFRNPATHSIDTVTGGIDEAMFVAYGTLVLLGVVERSSKRNRPG